MKPDINYKTLAPIGVGVLGYVLSPDFYNLLPDKYAHIIMGAAVIASAVSPQLLRKKEDVQNNNQTSEKVDKG